MLSSQRNKGATVGWDLPLETMTFWKEVRSAKLILQSGRQAAQGFADISFLFYIAISCCLLASSWNKTGLILDSFPTVMRYFLFFFLPFFSFLHRNCLHLRHSEKSSCWGWWKALQKRLESPAGPWFFWQGMREAIQNCSQAAVTASTPMLRLYFMQTQISGATVKLRLTILVRLLFLSQYTSTHRS